MHKYKISFLSHSITHEGRLSVTIEAVFDNIALTIFKDNFSSIKPFNVLIQRYIGDDELKKYGTKTEEEV